MFLWVRLLGVGDASEVWQELQRHQLVVIPGRAMHPRQAKFPSPSSCPLLLLAALAEA